MYKASILKTVSEVYELFLHNRYPYLYIDRYNMIYIICVFVFELELVLFNTE